MSGRPSYPRYPRVNDRAQYAYPLQSLGSELGYQASHPLRKQNSSPGGRDFY